jgi:hypothetical protein
MALPVRCKGPSLSSQAQQLCCWLHMPLCYTNKCQHCWHMLAASMCLPTEGMGVWCAPGCCTQKCKHETAAVARQFTQARACYLECLGAEWEGLFLRVLGTEREGLQESVKRRMAAAPQGFKPCMQKASESVRRRTGSHMVWRQRRCQLVCTGL